jgi:group I intron endonuclease
MTSLKRVCGVYIIYNCYTGGFYIGSSVNIKQANHGRWYHHRHLLEQGKHHCVHLQRAWNKYGAFYFDWHILKRCAPKDVLRWEQYYLDLAAMKWDRNRCYNVSLKAGKIEMTPMVRWKIGRAARRRLKDPTKHPLYGKKHSSLTRWRIKLKRRKQIVTEETRNKLRLNMLGVKRPAHSERMMGSSNPNYGKKHSSLIRAEISRILSDGRMRGSKNGRHDSRIYTFVNGLTKETYTGTRYEFYNKYPLLRSGVCQLLSGKAKTHKHWVLKKETTNV